MPPRTSIEIEQKVLAYNGKASQDEVALALNLSPSTIRKICNRNGVFWIWQRADQFGENNPNFISGLGRSTIERTTRRLVLQSGRSLYICERCGDISKDKEQSRHHKDRDRTNNTNENIEVLCQTCHVTEHNQDRERDESGRYVG